MLLGAQLVAAPETINIQGSLSDSGGDPLSGVRAYRVQFFGSVMDDTPLGLAIEGQVQVSASGRFSIEIVPPTQILSASEVYYEVGVDSADPADGTVDPGDSFPERVKVNSVLFAREADHAESADMATVADTATSARGLSGALTSPGDRVPLGDDVFLQVGADGVVEFLVAGRRFRLAGQRWIDPSGPTDNISPDGQAVSGPQVAINAAGDALVVWVQSDGLNDQIFRSQFRNGSWRDPVDLSDNISPNGQAASDPKVALSDNGDALIVWTQSDGSNQQIFRSEYRNGVWKDPTGLTDNISPDGEGGSGARIARNEDGEALIVWTQSDGSNLQIFRSQYRNGAWTDP